MSASPPISASSQITGATVAITEGAATAATPTFSGSDGIVGPPVLGKRYFLDVDLATSVLLRTASGTACVVAGGVPLELAWCLPPDLLPSCLLALVFPWLLPIIVAPIE